MNVPLFFNSILCKFHNIIPQIDSMAHSPSWELTDAHTKNKLPAPYGTQRGLPRSKELTTCPYIQPDKCSYLVTKYIVCNSAYLFVVTHHNLWSQAISLKQRNFLWLWLFLTEVTINQQITYENNYPFPIRNLGAVVAVRKCSPSGDQRSNVVSAASIFAISFRANVSHNSTLPWILPNPPRIKSDGS